PRERRCAPRNEAAGPGEYQGEAEPSHWAPPLDRWLSGATVVRGPAGRQARMRAGRSGTGRRHRRLGAKRELERAPVLPEQAHPFGIDLDADRLALGEPGHALHAGDEADPAVGPGRDP